MRKLFSYSFVYLFIALLHSPAFAFESDSSFPLHRNRPSSPNVGNPERQDYYYQEITRNGDLPDWIDDEDGTTTSFQSACGLVMETRLYLGSRTNFVFIGFRNSSTETKTIDFGKTRIRFAEGGSEPLTDFPEIKTPALKADETLWTILPILKKSYFKKAGHIAISVPVSGGAPSSECKIETRHQRNLNIPEKSVSFMEYTQGQGVFEGGFDILRTGRIKKYLLTGNQPALAYRFEFYPTFHHGLGYSLHYTDLGAPDRTHFPVGFSTNDVKSWSFIWNYNYRDVFWTRHYYYAILGLGYTGVWVSDGRGPGKTFSTGFVSTALSLSYEYVILSGREHAMEHAIGLTLSNSYLPQQKSKGFQVEGLNTALLLRYRIGN